MDGEVRINGNNVACRNRNRNGGGVLIYVKDKWTVSNTQKQNNIEMLSPDIKQYNSTKITITVVYRPPDANADWISTFENAVDKLIAVSSEAILLGDFNIDQFKNTNFRSTVEMNRLHQLIAQPTPVTPHSETLIDHIHVCNKFLYPKSNT